MELESVLKSIADEDWQGAPDPTRRGPVDCFFVQSALTRIRFAPAMVEGARSIGAASS